MPYCSNCGSEVGPGVKFCSNCGFPIGGASSSKGTVRPEVIALRPKPPLERAITLGGLAIGAILGILGFLSLGSPSGFVQGLGLFLILVGFTCILSSYGLSRARKWVRPVEATASMGCLAVGFLLVISLGIFTLLGLATMLLGVGTLVFLRRKPAK